MWLLCSGGVNLTINGNYLDSVYAPEVIVYVEGADERIDTVNSVSWFVIINIIIAMQHYWSKIDKV